MTPDEVRDKISYLGDAEDGNMWNHAEMVQEAYDALLNERDRYRDALERAARLAELEPDSLVGQVVRDALNDLAVQ